MSGRIPAEEQADAGRAIGRLSDLGWGTRLRSLLAETARDTELPDDVLDALVEVLKDWARGVDHRIVHLSSRRNRPIVAKIN